MVGDTTMADITVGSKIETKIEAVIPVLTMDGTTTVGTITTGTEETTIIGIDTERISIPVTGDNLRSSPD